MSSCCRAGPCEELFDARIAAWDLRRYKRSGLGRLERNMLRAVPAATLAGARVLEIGGGIGVLQAELLRRGAERGEVIELVAAYATFATQLATLLGLENRTSFRVADVLANPEAVTPADVVLLNRVICCSAEGLELTAVSAGLTRGSLLLSFPRDSLFARWFSRTQHALFRLLGRQFRFYVHPEHSVIAAAEAQGLTLVRRERGTAWEYLVFQRGYVRP